MSNDNLLVDERIILLAVLESVDTLLEKATKDASTLIVLVVGVLFFIKDVRVLISCIHHDDLIRFKDVIQIQRYR